jgi:hypothetical protein
MKCRSYGKKKKDYLHEPVFPFAADTGWGNLGGIGASANVLAVPHWHSSQVD